MAERVKFFLDDQVRFNDSLESAIRYLNSGEVIIVAAESAYIYLCDAFNSKAVKTIHTLRGDLAATLAQVFIRDLSVLTGIALAISSEQRKILEKFWPGPLSVTLPSQSGLSWDLGDERRLGKINVRIPKRRFLGEILARTGPLATASIAFSGKPAITDLSQIILHEADVGAIFDEGTLSAAPPSTIVEFSENNVVIIREGGVSRMELEPYMAPIMKANL